MIAIETPEKQTRVEKQMRVARKHLDLRTLISLFLVVLPVFLFYGNLLRTAVNIPFYDDYRAVILFVNGLSQTQGWGARVSYFFAAQHNEYKLFFEHAIVCLQYWALGHVNFLFLSAAGNLFVLGLGVLLWKLFLPEEKDIGFRLALFIPVSWLLFQFQYYETLNWATAGLQNLPVIAFAFTAIYLLHKKTVRSFAAATVCLVLAISASGNGFLLVPVGLLILILGRHYRRAAIWLTASLVCVAAYAYHYNTMSSQTSAHRSVFATLLHMQPAYALTFIGNAAGVSYLPGSIVLGVALVLFFGWMLRRGYGHRHPAICGCVLFILLTAIGVAGIRSDFGLAQSLAPRYAIYSDLLVIFAWFAIVTEFLQYRRGPLLHNGPYMAAVTIAIVFSVVMDGVGLILIGTRNHALRQGMALYQHPPAPGSTAGPDQPPVHADAARIEFNNQARTILADATRLKIYLPPQD